MTTIVVATIGSWSSWGVETNTLQDIVIKNDNWKFLSTLYHEKDHRHICYGATNYSQSSFKLNIKDARCNSVTTCGLILSYIHSWNTSYIGNLKCNLYHANDTFHIINNKPKLLKHSYNKDPEATWWLIK
jgi:hypothetical protein